MKPKPVTLPQFAKAFASAREAKGATHAEVSAAAGKNSATTVYWEHGHSEPGALALARACLFLGCTPNDLLLTGTLTEYMDDLTPTQAAQLQKLLKLMKPLLKQDENFYDVAARGLKLMQPMKGGA